MKPWPSMLPKDRLERVIAGLRELGQGEDVIEAITDYVEGRNLAVMRLTAEQQKIFAEDFQVLVRLTELVAKRSRDGRGIH